MIHRGFRLSLKWLLVVTLLALGGALLAACGGDDDDEAPNDVATTVPAGESPMDAGDASPTTGTTLAEVTSLCDLVTPEDVKDVLGESVTGVNEFKDVSCAYSIGSGSLTIEQGTEQDFEEGEGPFRTGDLGEPVPGIGDEAAWWGGDIYALNLLSVRQGDFYLRIKLGLAEVDVATQLEVAKELANRGVERLP